MEGPNEGTLSMQPDATKTYDSTHDRYDKEVKFGEIEMFFEDSRSEHQKFAMIRVFLSKKDFLNLD